MFCASFCLRKSFEGSHSKCLPNVIGITNLLIALGQLRNDDQIGPPENFPYLPHTVSSFWLDQISRTSLRLTADRDQQPKRSTARTVSGKTRTDSSILTTTISSVKVWLHGKILR